jgi:PhzF family phenazine biosynthesis protein
VSPEVLRYAAFTADPAGGNPAGVVLDARGMDDATMQAVAAEVGYSESAFLVSKGGGVVDIRYFSPLAEVPFCGHATIASAVAHAERNGPGLLRLMTRAGEVPVQTVAGPDGLTATLMSVAPRSTDLAPTDLAELLAALGWAPEDLDPALPPRVAFAGAWHPVLATATRTRLAELDYDFERLGALMAARDWTTVALVHRESDAVFHARDPFPPGGVVEDPATGAAAAALGGYLRELGLITPPARFTIHQGVDMGRPSRISVDVFDADSGIGVSGTAVALRMDPSA